MYVSGPSEYFTANDWLRTELVGGSWIELEEGVRDTLQCVTRRNLFVFSIIIYIVTKN